MLSPKHLGCLHLVLKVYAGIVRQVRQYVERTMQLAHPSKLKYHLPNAKCADNAVLFTVSDQI